MGSPKLNSERNYAILTFITGRKPLPGYTQTPHTNVASALARTARALAQLGLTHNQFLPNLIPASRQVVENDQSEVNRSSRGTRTSK